MLRKIMLVQRKTNGFIQANYLKNKLIYSLHDLPGVLLLLQDKLSTSLIYLSTYLVFLSNQK